MLPGGSYQRALLRVPGFEMLAILLQHRLCDPHPVTESETLGRAQETKFETKSPSGSYEEPTFEIQAEHDSFLRTCYRYPFICAKYCANPPLTL